MDEKTKKRLENTGLIKTHHLGRDGENEVIELNAPKLVTAADLMALGSSCQITLTCSHGWDELKGKVIIIG